MSQLSKEIKYKIRQFVNLSLKADKARKEIDQYFLSEYGLDLANDGNKSYSSEDDLGAGSINDILIDTAQDGNCKSAFQLIEEVLKDIISEEDEPYD